MVIQPISYQTTVQRNSNVDITLNNNHIYGLYYVAVVVENSKDYFIIVYKSIYFGLIVLLLYLLAVLPTCSIKLIKHTISNIVQCER